MPRLTKELSKMLDERIQYLEFTIKKLMVNQILDKQDIEHKIKMLEIELEKHTEGLGNHEY